MATEPNTRAGATRPAATPILLVPFAPAAAPPAAPRSAPLHQQVYDALRGAILDGRLAPGTRLPSSRTLAAELGVARNTVLEAFARLRTEGYVHGARGGGTRVRPLLPDALLAVGRPAAARVGRGRTSPGTLPGPQPVAGPDVRSRRNAPRPADAVAPRIAARSAALLAAGGALARTAAHPGARTAVPFRLHTPDVSSFPSRLWARLEARRWRRDLVHLGDGDPAGEPALRAAVAAYVAAARAARCTAEQVIVVSGTQQALDLCARLLLDPGDAAWVEDPGYAGAHAALASAGARLVPVPVDGEGLDVAAGERLAPDARLAYVTPSHQFPLGAVMSAPRRLALLAWARRVGAWVVEDDYDAEFRYAGRPLPCLQGLDAGLDAGRYAGDGPPVGPTTGATRVLYAGTFNKTLAPGLRLGYLVVPDALVDAARTVRAAADRHPPTLVQGVLADFVGEGHYARHLRRVRALYAERQAALLAAAPALDGRLALAPDPAGLHLVGWLPPGVRDAVAADAARALGVEVSALSRFTLGAGTICPHPGRAREALLLGYAAFDERAIRAGVDRLRRALAVAGSA